MNDPNYLVVDLFCGAGGTTTGFAMADNNIAKVIACVNHDPIAIKSHWENHPEVKHFEEDIRTLDLTELIAHVNNYQKLYPKAYLILWASLECTNFSKAKGGKPRDADSRTLAYDLLRYIYALDPDYIQIENVVEFMSWGPLDENGKPLSRKNGIDWIRWCKVINSIGYMNDWRELNSANYGAYTSRNRLFGIFAKNGLPICWPEPTHAKIPSKMSMHGDLKIWKPVKEVIDFSDEGESIFNRKKELKDTTLERIYAGLIKFVANGDQSFLSNYKSGNPKSKNTSINTACGTLTTIPTQALVVPITLLKYNSVNKNTKKYIPPNLDDPCPTIATQNRLGLIQCEFLDVIYGKGYPSSIDKPAPTLRTKDGLALIQTQYFIDKHFSKPANQSIDEPAGTIMPVDKHRLVEAVPFRNSISHNNQGISYIYNPSYGGHSSSIDNPCPVIVARQDKSPLSLIQATKNGIAIPIYDTDSEVMIRIKKFMIQYNIADIKMRLLRVLELLKIQGFPINYKLFGTQADQKKFIGNSVHPYIPKFWIEAMNQQ